MLFIDQSFAARIERAECKMLSGCVAALEDRVDGILQIPIAGGSAIYTGTGSPLNKLIGLGFDGPVDEAELEAVEKAFAERDATVQVELSTLADPSVGAMLTRRGYSLAAFENVLGRPLDSEFVRPPDIVVRLSEMAEVDTWVDVMVSGFMVPDQGDPEQPAFPRELLEGVMREFCAADNSRRYLVEQDGELIGGAGMSVNDGIAVLNGASTMPAFRRRGVQSALLAHRLADAKAAGCDLAVMTTEPGSKSQRNGQRCGFQLLYPRAILQRSPS